MVWVCDEAVWPNLRSLGHALAFLVSFSCLGCVPDIIHGETFDAGVDSAVIEAAIVPSAQTREPDAQVDATRPALAGPCDLTGSWLLTMRQITSSIGAKQLGKAWHFIQIAQNGSAFVVTRAHLCGNSNVGLPPFVLSVEDTPSWPTYAVRPDTTYQGVKGSASESSTGCDVSFDRFVTLRGVTADYLDESLPLPNADQKADGVKPGWEDWDNDQHPGVTQNVSGTLSGLVYLAMRFWIELSGTIQKSADDFQLDILWDVERSTLGYDGTPLFTAPASADGDYSVQFVEFARFPAEMIVDDPQQLCATVRTLAATLNPKANE